MAVLSVFGLAFIVAPRRWLAMALAALVVLCPLLRLAVGSWLETRYSNAQAAFAIYTFPGLHFDAFAMGALLAIFGPKIGWRRLANVLTVVGLLAMAGYCMTYVMVNASHGARDINLFMNVISGIGFGDRREVFLYSSIDLASVALVAIAVAGGGILDPLLSQKWLQAIGRVSYGGYIYHSAVLGLILWAMKTLHFDPPGSLGAVEHNVLELVLGLPLTIALALASYRWFEQPLMRKANDWLRPRAAAIS